MQIHYYITYSAPKRKLPIQQIEQVIKYGYVVHTIVGQSFSALGSGTESWRYDEL